jgi:hypothetical protein
MADELTIAIVFAAAILGGLTRSLLPYLRKLAAAEAEASEIPFQRRYIFTVVLSIVTSTILAVTVFPSLVDNLPASESTAGMAGVFIYGFLATWGMNDVLNQIMATGAAASETTLKKKVVAKPAPKDKQADPDSTLPIK